MPRGGTTGHSRIPDWTPKPNWEKGMPGLHGGRRGRSHTLDPRARTALPVGQDVKIRSPRKSSSGGTKARW